MPGSAGRAAAGHSLGLQARAQNAGIQRHGDRNEGRKQALQRQRIGGDKRNCPLTEGAANNSPLRLVARKIPIGRPNIVASDAATETMNRLSPVASMIRLMRSRDITKALHRKLILRKPGQCLPLRGLIAGNTERQRADVLTSDLVDPGRQQSYIDAKLACEARYDGIARIRSPYLHANNGPTASYRLRVQPAYQRNRNILA